MIYSSLRFCCDYCVPQAALKDSREKAKSVFGGLFGKVSMYGDKEGVVVYHGKNPKCFFDVKV